MAQAGSLRRRGALRKKKAALRTAKARGAATERSSGLSIEDDRLVGAGLSFVETPNKGGDLAPRYLMFHYTAGKSATSSIDWLTNPESKASAHLVLARDGTITQFAPFNVKTWKIKAVGESLCDRQEENEEVMGAQGRLSSGGSSAIKEPLRESHMR